MREPIVISTQGGRLFAIHEALTTPYLVLILHGFASNKVGTNRAWVRLGEALATAGIASCRFDFRGCGDSDGDLPTLSFYDLVDDAVAVYKALAPRYKRIGFFGSSMGGSISIEAATRVKVASVATWAPVARGSLIHWEKPMQYEEEFRGLSLDKRLKSLGEMPFLHMQGEKDPVVTLEHQKVFQEARAGSTAKTVFLTYPECAHVLGQAEVFPEVLQTTVNWFKETL
jgi:alpha-beta hydrolase superfamily lysophospholipase